MIKKQMRTLGHKAIVKNNRSHQEAFDELDKTEGIDRELLAEELSKIPSSGKQKSSAVLRYLFIACLGILVLLRVASILIIQMEGMIDLRFLVFLALIVLLAPGLGIYAALFHKVEFYKSAGFLLLISLFQSVRRGELVLDQDSLIVIIPFIAAMFLAFYIPSRLKTPYKKTVSEKFVDGKLIKKTNYVFEDTRFNSSEILDSQF